MSPSYYSGVGRSHAMKEKKIYVLDGNWMENGYVTVNFMQTGKWIRHRELHANWKLDLNLAHQTPQPPSPPPIKHHHIPLPNQHLPSATSQRQVLNLVINSKFEDPNETFQLPSSIPKLSA